MADEHNFPTAIIPTRPEGQRARFRRLAEVYGDPMQTLFEIQSGPTEKAMVVDGQLVYVRDDSLRKEAAKELMPYGYRKQAAAGGLAGLFGGGEDGDGSDIPAGFTLNIHFAGTAPPLPVIDVTPPRPELPAALSPDLEEMLR